MSSNIFDINYNQTGKSKSTNTLGMREMQERAFEKRNSKHLLIKAPCIWKKSSFNVHWVRQINKSRT